MRIEGKVWVITGGGNGIGRALVLEALGRGGRVAALDLRREGLDETAASANAGERLSTHVVDVTDRARVASLPEEVAAVHGAVAGLINNAGIIQPFVRIPDLDPETIDRAIGADARIMNLALRLIPKGATRLMARLIEKQMKPALEAKTA